MKTFSALYADGQSARQVQCTVELVDQSLKLNFNNDGYTFLIWPISKLHTVQFNGSNFVAHFGEYPHQSIQITGSQAVHVHSIWVQRKPLQKTLSLNTKKITVVLLSLMAIIVGMALFSWFVVLPWAASKAVALIPVETEISIGENLAKAYTQEHTEDDSLSFYLQAFANELKLDSIYPIKTEVIRSNEINAFALPGGYIFVYSGIIQKMNSYEELVALLGHESSHVSNRHSLKSMSRSAAGGLIISAVFSDAAGVSTAVMDQADQLQQLDYSRELETEADAHGLQKMINNKVSGRGMLDLLKLLKKEGAELPALMKYLSTHPNTDARIEAVQTNTLSKQSFERNQTLEDLFQKLKAKI